MHSLGLPRLAASFLILILTSLALAGCRDGEIPTAPDTPSRAPRPSLALSDAAHGGNPHFYFLPPLVPAAAFRGTFDPKLAPEVHVCALRGATCGADLVVFTGASRPAVTVDPAGEAYKVLWETKNAGLSVGGSYRIRVVVGRVELGFADLLVVANDNDLNRLPAGFVGVVNGRPLQIKFRIEQGFVGSIRVAPGNQEMEVHATQRYEALFFDLHGHQVSSPREATWASTDPGVLSISRTGVGRRRGSAMRRSQSPSQA